jgi:DNA-binding transcriptional MerR regulator
MGTSTVEATGPVQRHQSGYAIRDVARVTRLSESALRYYESIGLTPAISRNESSGHRIYSQDDLDNLDAVACLNGTGMPIEDMRVYLSNRLRGVAGASGQIGLLEAHRHRLDEEAKALEVRQRYIELKIRYWQAVAVGDDAEADRIGDQVEAVAQSVKDARGN